MAAVQSVVPILNVSDVRASIDWFAQLGWEKRFTWNEESGERVGFAGIGSGEAELFLCRDGQGSRGLQRPEYPFDESTDGVWLSWFVETLEDLESMYARVVELGLDVTMPPTDEPWGIREFHLRHPDGHTFRIGCELR